MSFHEHGAVRRSPFRNVTVRYSEAEFLSYRATRQHYNGLYVGTVMDFKLHGPGRQTVRFHGRHKERRRGFLTPHFEGLDEMDEVRVVVSARIADRLGDRVGQGELIPWGRATIGLEGVTVRRFPGRERTLRYEDVARVQSDGEWLNIYAAGERRAFLCVQSTGKNFYPCYELFARLLAASRPERAQAA